MSPDKRRRYRRSPYLILLWSGNEPCVLHAHTLARFRAHSKLITLLSRLGEWSTAEELAAAGDLVGSEKLEGLHALGLLQADDDVADRGSPYFTWDPLELAVQRRTAHGGAMTPPLTGGPPPRKSRAHEVRSRIDLPRPAPALSEPLSSVLQRRRSVRSYATRPLELRELSTLLYHAARVVQIIPSAQRGEGALRPFPTAGARSALEIYVVSGDVAGLDPGAHRYDAHEHRLIAIRKRDAHQDLLLRSVNAATGDKLDREPPVVLLITAVFEQVMWKYQNLGLSLLYKDVGALFQTLYLVATALGLSPCAVGSGDEAENSRWLGLDPLCESQVGCFLIGPGSGRRDAPGGSRIRASTSTSTSTSIRRRAGKQETPA